MYMPHVFALEYCFISLQILGNTASQAGGGLYFYGPQADIECMDTVLIASNNAEVSGDRGEKGKEGEER